MTEPRVLLVDDDPDIALGARIRLEAAGYRVTTAYDGEEGLASALESPPDAIVLDIRMPKRDGFSLLEAVREDPRTRDLPAIVLTANGIDENRTRAHALGARFLRKPYEPRRLIEMLAEALHPAV